MANELYLGLMSGTSMDGLDACLLQVSAPGKLQVLATASAPLPSELTASLHRLCSPGNNEIDTLCRAQNALAKCSASLVKKLLAQCKLRPADITAIGSHGQTVRHCPQQGYTLQLDNGPLCALLTGIDVWTNFRAQDVAAGGEGAPLTPLFHQQVLSSPVKARFILNLGGIANVTALRPGGEMICGFDTGPANTLLDLACRQLFNCPYDQDGARARAGVVQSKWLEQLLDHPYFARKPPKSSGRELFNADYIAFMLAAAQHEPQLGNDVLATLTAFSVQTIAQALQDLILTKELRSDGATVVVCGGGARNGFFMQELVKALQALKLEVVDSGSLGVDAQYLEAEAFAYFAYLSTHGRVAAMQSITGARCPVILGTLCPSPQGRFSARPAG